MKKENKELSNQNKLLRRNFLKTTALVPLLFLFENCGSLADKKKFFQKSFRVLKDPEKADFLKNLQKKYSEKYGKKFEVSGKKALENTDFAYALDISRCVGCRKCVYACAEENNISTKPQIHWIQVLEMDKKKGVDFSHANLFYDHKEVPHEGHFYLPVSCQQCNNAPCVKSCPVKATWQEDDGIVVVDYDWCIGCRCCMASCPYGARHFNWKTPNVDKEKINPKTHVLGNRPRENGVVEKCTFCIQRVREGRYPACVEACPVGARKFGNLLDPDSEIQYILKNKRVMVLKKELNTQPNFFYFYAT